MSQRICKNCGKSEVSTRAGSLTSFFFQHNFCHCKGLPQAARQQNDSHSPVCKSCGKSRPEKKRAGSFTSFLFQELRCTCPGETRNPTATRAAQRSHSSSSRLNASPDRHPGDGLGDSSKETVFQAGDIIGNAFRVENQIGLGGMGVVYLVQHTALNKQFALKVLAPDLVNEQNWLRFQAEAKTMASLSHRTFVKVYDLGIHAKAVPFYSMDYLKGRSLETIVIEDGPFQLEQALDIFLEVLDGLAYAHRHNIIHRDIKPANIMLCTAGSAKTATTDSTSPSPSLSLSNSASDSLPTAVKVLDFGISKFVGSDASKKQSLTAAGDIFGSPFYMSPEQCRGDTVDARSDIYSIGCALFEVLTGFVPYEGKNSVETTIMHQEYDPPRLSDVSPELEYPPSVDIAIAKCLAKDPEDRYQSAKELAIDLMRIKEGQDLRGYSGSYSNDHASRPVTSKIAMACTITGALVVTAAALITQTKLLATKPPNAFTTAKGITTNSNSIANVELLDEKIAEKEPDLTAIETAQIKKFLASRTEPYSRTENSAGKKVSVFNFPTKFSIGLLGCTKADTHKFTRVTAQGNVATAFGTRVHINAEQNLQCFPQLIKFFRPNELEWVKINDSKAQPSDFFPDLVKQQKLSGLELRNSQIADLDLPWLEKLPSLKSLDIGNTRVTGSGLAKSKVLKQLNCIHACKLKSATPLLKALAETHNITELNLNDVKLSTEDYSLISQLTSLKILSLKDSSIEDADLDKLTSLENLETLYIDRCHRLTLAAVDILRKFKKLKVLRPPDQIEDSFSEENLRRSLPGLRLM